MRAGAQTEKAAHTQRFGVRVLFLCLSVSLSLMSDAVTGERRGQTHQANCTGALLHRLHRVLHLLCSANLRQRQTQTDRHTHTEREREGDRGVTWCSRPCGDQVTTSMSYWFRCIARGLAAPAPLPLPLPLPLRLELQNNSAVAMDTLLVWSQIYSLDLPVQERIQL